MKTRFLTFLMLFFIGSAFAQGAFPHPDFYFPEPVQSDDGMNGTCVALIYLNGVQVEEEATFEIAFFDEQGNCRQRDFVHHWVAPTGTDFGYQFQSVMYGNSSGQTLTFKFYNHTLQKSSDELGYVCITSFRYYPNVEFGILTAPENVYFVTPTTCTFTNVDGNNWSTATNWSPRIPASCDDAVIAANSICVIDEDATVAYKTLTIKDGAQFVGDGEEYLVTFEKEIAAYTPGTRNNYYFIANPTDGEFLETENLLEGNFDLYFFDECGVDDPDAEEPVTREWQNYKDPYYSNPEDFSAAYNAYLYANDANTTLRFSGLIETRESVSYKKIPMMGGENFNGFNLIGNPYTCNVSVSKGTYISGFYVLNNHTEVIPLNNPIVAPCSAIFAVSTRNNNNNASVTFTPNINGTGARNIENLINIEVSNNDNLLDRAYVRFNEQDNLQKFTLNPEATHIYFREEGKDYAIVKGNERMSQLPLYFETREYGVYTINVKLENMNCEYLHLIDNRTGADIDLNTTPSYTFRANQGDYACRFKLVFEGTGLEGNTASENFAIVEGKRVIIPMIEHETTLEIIDMTGRTISSQKVNGSFDQTLNVNAGIYLLRMNGNVQKIVVR